ncbi:MAG: bifunctional riboflavin kinase/FAD synthetase, partial [candidate division KSB1 bacterium]
EAHQREVSTTVVTFEPHPQLVVQRNTQTPIQILSTLAEKLELLQSTGVDRIIAIPFTKEFSQTPSEKFVREILHATIGMQAIIIGHDHSFGKNREGDVATLTSLGRELNFEVSDLPPFECDGTVVSSTRIRQALLSGELEKANAWLGSTYRFTGKVVRGEGRGKTIGVPTANLEPVHAHKLIPANGVYAVRVKWREAFYNGMMNLGTRPTFNGQARSLEVHLFDFAADLYDERIEVHFSARLRGEKKFSSIDDLKAQLQLDRAESLKMLAEA